MEESKFFVRNKATKRYVSPRFDFPLQANSFHKNQKGDSPFFEIVKVKSKKALCEHCGEELKQTSYSQFVCPICHTKKTIF